MVDWYGSLYRQNHQFSVKKVRLPAAFTAIIAAMIRLIATQWFEQRLVVSL